MKSSAALGALAALLLAGASPAATRYARADVEVTAPAVTLVAEDGSRVRLAEELARPGPVAVQFVFSTCATICPVMTATLAEARRRHPELRALSFTIDPEHDTPERLRAFAARHGAGRGWRFLTGRPEDLLQVQRAFDVDRGDKMRHQPATFLRGAPGGRWLRLDGFPSAADLAAEIAALAAAPAAGAGERIYREGVLPSGAPLAAVLAGDVPASGRAVACATCHRPSGFGGVEGTVVVPPVTAPVLFAERPPPTGLLFRALFQEELGPQPWSRVRAAGERPPYDEASLVATLREGADPGGRRLDPLMPRYSLSDADAAHLTAYLRTLAAAPPPGVEPERIHFATVVTPDADPARRAAWLEVAAAYVRWRNAALPGLARKAAATPGYGEDLTGRRRAWELHVWELSGPAKGWAEQLAAHLDARPVFALLGGTGGDWRPVHEFCERHRVPCLFPDTDLPVPAPRGDYGLYLTGGPETEGTAVARHLLEKAQVGRRPLRTLVVRRGSSVGAVPPAMTATARAAADLSRALRRALAGSPQVVVEERVLAPGEPPLLARGRRRPDALMLWLPAADLAGLPAAGPGAPSHLYLSWSLLGEAAPPLAAGWRERAFVTWPYALPGEEGPHGHRTRAWLRSRGVAAAGDTGDDRRRLMAHWTLSLADHALAHLGATLSRDAFVEAVEREAEREPNPGVFPRLSLGPGQRIASKSCSVLPLADAAGVPR